MAVTNQKRSLLSRIGRWTAELVLVFVGVYAAFWLNNYQQRQQDQERHDRILASIEQTLREGIESNKVSRAKEQQQVAEFRRALDIAFPKAPLRSRTVGFPESGSDLGPARSRLPFFRCTPSPDSVA